MDRYPSTTGLFRISNSDIQCYLQCGERYRLKRQDNIQRTTVRMAVGSAVARGAQRDNESKIVSAHGLPIRDIIDVAVAEYETVTANSELPDTRAEVASGKDDSASAARVFAIDVSPRIVPIAAEKKTIVQLGEDLELAGTIDYATADGIGDLKCGKPWSQFRADPATQLSAYGWIFRGLYGEFPRRVWIDSVHRDKRGWAASRLWSSRTQEDYTAFLRLLRCVHDGIQSGVFVPASELDWRCSPTYCEYWHVCQYQAGRRYDKAEW
jgi:hypothetical protein